MTFAIERGADRRVFLLAGELDLATAPRLLETVEPELAESGDVVLDLTELTFLDSTGIRAMLRIAQGLEGGRLMLLRPTSGVRRVLDIVGAETLDSLVIVDETE